METDMVLISRGEVDQLLTYLRRAHGFCANARPTSYPMTTEDLHAEPTDFYSGANGYARATMGMVINALESSLQ